MKNKKIIILVTLVTLVVIGLIVVICLLLNSDEKTKTEKVEKVVETGNEYDDEEPEENDEQEESEKTEESEEKLLTSEGIAILPTMNDKIDTDSSWCATFQLVWNDLKNEVVKQDIKFEDEPENETVKNLNKEDFTDEMISEEYYYKTYGLKTLDLKKEIEDGIKEKFDQESDVLNNIDWSEEELDKGDDENKRYLFYAMLYREFEYPKEFEELNKGKFGDKYDNVEYFGVTSYTSDEVKKQVKVLYYNDEDDFTVVLKTKNNDEVILCKKPEGSTFNEIYNNINKKAEEFDGKETLQDEEVFKTPKLKFNQDKEYEELQGKDFKTKDDKIAKIEKAIQTIQFEIDEKGGKVKSEAAADTLTSSLKENKKRTFNIDDTFALFLKEEDKETPYFAARIEDISKFQASVKKTIKEGEEKEEEEKLEFNFDDFFTNKVKNYKEKYADKKEKSTKDIVYTGYKKEEKEEGSYDVKVQIPYINVKGETIEKYNEEIKKAFEKKVETILETEDKNYGYDINYGAYIKDDILSLIIKAELQQGSKKKLIIETYNYNLEEEKEVKLEDLLDTKEIDTDEVQKQITKKIKEENKKAEQLKELGHDVYERDLESDEYDIENIDNFYIDNGNICIIFAYGNKSNTIEKDIVLIPIE